MKITKNQILLIIGIIFIIYGQSNGMFLTLADYISGYETITFAGIDGSGIIKEGATSAPIVYNGNTYTVKVNTVSDGAGYAAITFYKNNIQMAGTLQSVAPSCCADYYLTPVQIDSVTKGSVLCYTGTDLQTFCYAKAYISTSSTVYTCTIDGVVYNDGDQVKLVNGCYSTFTGKVCYDNYQFATCSGGKLMGIGLCYPGENCGLVDPQCTNSCPSGTIQLPYPDCLCSAAPVPDCVSGQMSSCILSDDCDGLQTCTNGIWGACIKNDKNCGKTWIIPEWVYYLLIGGGILLVLYGLVKK